MALSSLHSASGTRRFFVCPRGLTQVRKIVTSWLSRLVLTYDCKKEMETALHGNIWQSLAVA